MNGDILNIGIIGAGNIAGKAAMTLKGMEKCKAYAVASRTLEKAKDFARQWNVTKAYGSYAELIADPDVDLVYVAVPHSHHYGVTRQALLADKPCLVEKAFMANHRQAQEIISLSRERKVFLAEALWTRYQPAVGIVRQLIAEGRIGEPRLITATLAYSMGRKPRIMQPELCGGALLDLGVYALNFVRMLTGNSDIVSVQSQCVKSDTGMDLTNAISMVLANGMVANVQTSTACIGENIGVISGTEGCLIIDNINNPQKITVYARNRVLVDEIHVPEQITGYEYEFESCRKAIKDNLLEAKEMPLDESLYIMQLMDNLRMQWGVHYPMDDEWDIRPEQH